MKKSANYQVFTNVKNCDNINKVVMFLDWFEVRVRGYLNYPYLYGCGYDPRSDFGNSTHNHFYENELFTVSWDIKAVYIKDSYIHVKIQNSAFYASINPITYMNELLKDLFSVVSEVFVSRIDFAFDMCYESEIYNHLKNLFINQEIHKRIERYGCFEGCFNGRRFINYFAGNRGSKYFYRLYNKTVENTDYHTKAPRKEYIKKIHDIEFGRFYNGDIYRFEIEVKPKKLNLVQFDDVWKYFGRYFSKFFVGFDLPLLWIGDNYISTKKFNRKDAIKLLSLFDKYQNEYSYNIENNTLKAVIYDIKSLL